MQRIKTSNENIHVIRRCK